MEATIQGTTHMKDYTILGNLLMNSKTGKYIRKLFKEIYTIRTCSNNEAYNLYKRTTQRIQYPVEENIEAQRKILQIYKKTKQNK